MRIFVSICESFRLATWKPEESSPNSAFVSSRQWGGFLRDRAGNRWIDSSIESREQLRNDHELEIAAIDQRWRDKIGLATEKRVNKEKRKIRQDAIDKSRATTLGKVVEGIALIFSGF